MKIFIGAFLASIVANSNAFQQSNSHLHRGTSSLNMVAVDPTTVTNKEYEDICGVSFDESDLAQRLKATNYLHPKHVEVIEDIAPIAGAMVDEIVSPSCSVSIVFNHVDAFRLS